MSAGKMNQQEIGFCPICNGVEEETINEILAFAKKLSFAGEERVYMQGDPFCGIFVIIEGAIRLSTQNEQGKEYIVKKLGAGEIFGESGINNRHCLETAQALCQTTCIFLPNKEFEKLVEKSPHLSSVLVQLMGGWIADFYERFQTLSFTSVRDRVEHFLMSEFKKREKSIISLKLKRHEIASNLGIRPETLSRVLTGLQKEKLISINGNNEIDLSCFKNLTK